MKFQVIICFFLVIMFSIKSYSADCNTNDTLSNAISIKLSYSYDEVWSALFMTLVQDSAQIKYINRQKGSIETDFTCLSANKKDTLIEKLVRISTKLERTYVKWSDEICYAFLISVSNLDTLNTLLKVNTEIYTQSRSGPKYIFQSNGSLEKELINKTNINLTKLKNNSETIAPYVGDFFSNGPYSGESECIIDKSKDEVWTILQKIIHDYSIPIEFEDQSFGIIVSQGAPLIDDQKNLFVKNERVNPIKDKDETRLISIWKWEFGFSLRIFVAPIFEDMSKSKVFVRTFLKAYDPSKINVFPLYKSTGAFEKEFLSALKLNMAVFAPLDRIPYFNVHLDSVVSRIYPKPISTVWNSVIKNLKDNKLKMDYFEIDSCIYGVTHFQFINDSYLSLEFVIERISEDSCKISLTSSNRIDNPDERKIGARYKKSTNRFVDAFLEKLATPINKIYPVDKDIKKYVDESFHKYSFPDSEIESFINDFEIFESISLIPDYELFPNGIHVISEADELNLNLFGYVKQPIEFESSDDIRLTITNWIFHRLVYNLGNSLYYQFKDVAMFNHIVFETKIKVYNLDDSTPIDLSYHTYQVKIKTVDLINLLKFKTNFENIIHSSIIKFDGEEVDMLKIRSN